MAIRQLVEVLAPGEDRRRSQLLPRLIAAQALHLCLQGAPLRRLGFRPGYGKRSEGSQDDERQVSQAIPWSPPSRDCRTSVLVSQSRSPNSGFRALPLPALLAPSRVFVAPS